MQKKGLLKIFAGVCLVLVLVLLIPLASACAPAAPEEAITLTAIRAQDWDQRETTWYRGVVTRVNDEMAGRLEIKDLGGAEVFPASEQLDAVIEGAVDICSGPTGYYLSVFPELDITWLTFRATPSEFRAAGLVEALDKIAREKLGVAVLGISGYHEYNLYLKNPIETLDDLNGVKVRAVSPYLPVLEPLGLAAAAIPFTETYSALEKGVVDGFCWPATGAHELGFTENIGYQVYPYFWTTCGHMTFISAAKFDALPSDIRDELMDIVKDGEAKLLAENEGFTIEELALTRAQGVEPIVISDDEWLDTQGFQWEGASARLRETAPEHADELLKVIADAGWYPPKKIPPVPK